MKTKDIIIANIIILVAILPCFLVLNEGESLWPNLFGIAYGILLYKFGYHLAPKVVRKYWDFLDREAEEKDIYYK